VDVRSRHGAKLQESGDHLDAQLVQLAKFTCSMASAYDLPKLSSPDKRYKSATSRRRGMRRYAFTRAQSSNLTQNSKDSVFQEIPARQLLVYPMAGMRGKKDGSALSY
jgi:hypothetical protein